MLSNELCVCVETRTFIQNSWHAIACVTLSITSFVCVCLFVFMCLHQLRDSFSKNAIESLTRWIIPAAVNQTDINMETSCARRIELDVFSTFKYCNISGTVMRRSALRKRRPTFTNAMENRRKGTQDDRRNGFCKYYIHSTIDRNSNNVIWTQIKVCKVWQQQQRRQHSGKETVRWTGTWVKWSIKWMKKRKTRENNQESI